MAASEDGGRITVSRDALRAELVTLELRLVEKLATQAEVEAINRRLTVVEESMSRLKGALALVSVVAVSLLGLALKHLA